MKVYLPTTTRLLSHWLAEGSVAAAQAFAVTTGLRREFPDADDDDLEYHVLAEAGERSLLLAAADHDPTTAGLFVRRAVVVAEVASVTDLRGGAPIGVVAVPAAISWRQVGSLHVDDQDALPAVAAAVSALRAGTVEDELNEVSGYELMWFDVSEAPDVLSLLLTSPGGVSAR